MPGLNDAMRNSDEQRVVVTGLGTVNAMAGDPREFAAALRRGICGIGPISLFDTTAFRTHNGAQVKDFDPRAAIPGDISLKRMSRSDLLALAAALQALAQAGLDPVPEELREEMGVVIGGGAGGLLEAETFFPDYLRRGGRSARFSRLAPVCCASTANHLSNAIQPLGTEDDDHDGLLLGGDGHRPGEGPDPQRRRPGDDRRRNGAALPDDVCILQCPSRPWIPTTAGPFPETAPVSPSGRRRGS